MTEEKQETARHTKQDDSGDLFLGKQIAELREIVDPRPLTHLNGRPVVGIERVIRSTNCEWHQ